MPRTRRTQKQLQRAVSTARFLQAVPYVNQAMSVSQRADGGALASIPIPRPRYLVPPLSWILPFSPQRRVELEPVGAGVLKMCDGKRSVEAIIEQFAAAHRLTFREAQIPVTQFLRQLMERGLVVIVGSDEKADAT